MAVVIAEKLSVTIMKLLKVLSLSKSKQQNDTHKSKVNCLGLLKLCYSEILKEWTRNGVFNNSGLGFVLATFKVSIAQLYSLLDRLNKDVYIQTVLLSSISKVDITP